VLREPSWTARPPGRRIRAYARELLLLQFPGIQPEEIEQAGILLKVDDVGQLALGPFRAVMLVLAVQDLENDGLAYRRHSHDLGRSMGLSTFLAFFAARFSFSVLPAFLAFDFCGDLSDTMTPQRD
jgi:hypothetical protein